MGTTMNAIRNVVGLFVGIILAGGIVVAQEHTKDSLETVKKALADKKAVLIDVREKTEWDAGHLADAKLLPLSSLKDEPLPKEVSALLPKDKVRVPALCGGGPLPEGGGDPGKSGLRGATTQGGVQGFAEGRVPGGEIAVQLSDAFAAPTSRTPRRRPADFAWFDEFISVPCQCLRQSCHSPDPRGMEIAASPFLPIPTQVADVRPFDGEKIGENQGAAA